jgi:hypothetical protein
MTPDEVKKLEAQHQYYIQRGAKIARDHEIVTDTIMKKEHLDPVLLNLRNVPHWTEDVDQLGTHYNALKAFNIVGIGRDLAEWLSRCETKEISINLDGELVQMTVPQDDSLQKTADELMSAAIARRYIEWQLEVLARRDTVARETQKWRDYPITEMFTEDMITREDGQGRDRRITVYKDQINRMKEEYQRKSSEVDKLKAELAQLKQKPPNKDKVKRKNVVSRSMASGTGQIRVRK